MVEVRTRGEIEARRCGTRDLAEEDLEKDNFRTGDRDLQATGGAMRVNMGKLC